MSPAEKLILFRTYQDLCRALDRSPSAEELGAEVGLTKWEVTRWVYPWLRRCDGLTYPVNNPGGPKRRANNPGGTANLPVDRYMEKNHALPHWE